MFRGGSVSEDDEQTEPAGPGDTPWRDGETGRFRPARFGERGRAGPGRPRGSPNRATVQMRNAISAVFEDLQASHEGPGEYPHFLAWAKENPTDFYRIAARQLPLQIETTSRTIGLVIYKGLNDQTQD